MALSTTLSRASSEISMAPELMDLQRKLVDKRNIPFHDNWCPLIHQTLLYEFHKNVYVYQHKCHFCWFKENVEKIEHKPFWSELQDYVGNIMYEEAFGITGVEVTN